MAIEPNSDQPNRGGANMKKLVLGLALSLTALAASTQAKAITFFDFKYQDKSLGGLKFSIDASKPSTYYSEDLFLQYVNGNIYTFYPRSNGGGFTINEDCCNLSGPQLYTGPEKHPTFFLGTFKLFEPTYGPAVITITGDGVSAIPETETWALFIIGLGVIGSGMRRCRRAFATAV